MYRRLYKLTYFLGFAPRNLIVKKVYCIFPIISFIFYIGTALLWLRLRFVRQAYIKSTTNIALTIAHFSCQIFYCTLCFVFTLLKAKNWRSLLAGLAIENGYSLNFKELVFLLFLHLLFLFVIVVEIYAFAITFTSPRLVCAALIYHTRQYYQNLMAYFINVTAKLLAKNYRGLDLEFQTSLKTLRLYPGLSREVIVLRLMKMMNCYRDNEILVLEFNVLFGKQIGIYFATTIFEILSGVSFYIKMEHISWIFLFTYMFQVFISVVSF